jgi:hypothetical protein
MRIVLLCTLVLILSLPTAILAADTARGSLSVDQGSGLVTIRGKGALIGRLARGQLLLVDLSPLDAWIPRVNGVQRARFAGARQREVNFYVPGGRYRVVIRGEGISISARGTGAATLAGEPDATGGTGTFWVGEGELAALPLEPATVTFGADRVVEPTP